MTSFEETKFYKEIVAIDKEEGVEEGKKQKNRNYIFRHYVLNK